MQIEAHCITGAGAAEGREKREHVLEEFEPVMKVWEDFCERVTIELRSKT